MTCWRPTQLHGLKIWIRGNLPDVYVNVRAGYHRCLKILKDRSGPTTLVQPNLGAYKDLLSCVQSLLLC